MLVIKRRAGERIRIGDNVEIVVLEVTPAKVTIGIEAPGEVRVAREEVCQVENENAAASRIPTRVEAALRKRLESL